MKIAVSGKGGVGKTTISSNLAKLFASKGYNVYAVDADPDSSLGLALGIDENLLNKIKPIVEMKEMIGDKIGNGAFYKLNPLLDDIAEDFCIKINNINFLKMGGLKQGGSDCYCRENTFLKALVNSLLLDTKDVVILDMGAGIEHLTRGTSNGVDVILIVTEAGKSSVQTSRVVEELAKDLKIKNIKFVGNKVRNEMEEAFIKKNYKKDELIGIIHYDDSIAQKSMGELEVTGVVDNDELESILSSLAID